MLPRLYVDHDLHTGLAVTLPQAQSRHIQVLRLQPGSDLWLFNGRGGEWRACIEHIARRDVRVLVMDHRAEADDAGPPVVLAAAIPANERFEWLIEKATELGAAAIRPLICERSVVRIDATRAARKLQHWRDVATAAAEQCGRTRLLQIEAPQPLSAWLRTLAPGDATVLLLSLEEARPLGWKLTGTLSRSSSITVVSGPEGGLSPSEEESVVAAGGLPVSLGRQVLRAETAPLVALARLTAPA